MYLNQNLMFISIKLKSNFDYISVLIDKARVDYKEREFNSRNRFAYLSVKTKILDYLTSFLKILWLQIVY